MKAARISPAPPGSPPYSGTNIAPASAISLPDNLPIPVPSKPGEIVVRVKASTVIRDNLTWPELYDDDNDDDRKQPAHLGNDFSGIVSAVHDGDGDTQFKPGDEVYGMADAHRGGTWAEYARLGAQEVALKPAHLSFEEAASLPLSALTADQALFEHGGLELRAEGEGKRVLITGSSGGVGRFLVQFAARAGHRVVAASSSNARNDAYLRSLGAGEVIEYGQFEGLEGVDVVVDTVGGKALESCWKVINDGGILISIDSADMDWIKTHKAKGFDKGKESVKPVFFIVVPSKKGLMRIAEAVADGSREGLVAKVLPFDEAREAYELAHSGNFGRGKVVLKM